MYTHTHTHTHTQSKTLRRRIGCRKVRFCFHRWGQEVVARDGLFDACTHFLHAFLCRCFQRCLRAWHGHVSLCCRAASHAFLIPAPHVPLSPSNSARVILLQPGLVWLCAQLVVWLVACCHGAFTKRMPLLAPMSTTCMQPPPPPPPPQRHRPKA